MKSSTKRMILLLLPVILASVLLVQGCGDPLGSQDDASDAGCPEGTVLATGSDVMTELTDDWQFNGYVTGLPPGSTVNIPLAAPAVFVVTDQFASEKNDVCVLIYTSAVVYTDSSRATVQAPINGRYPMKTDSTGAVSVFASAPVLVSNPATSSNVDGDDAEYSFSINAFSGALAAQQNIDITVLGCPAATFGLGTCP